MRPSELLPAPLGPRMPSASPDLRLKCTPVTIGVPVLGVATVACSTTRLRAGLGRGVVARFAAPRASASDNRLMLWRAAMKARQFAIVVSIGASARPIMIEAAIMAP